jgi:hypothetical protein
MSLIHHSESLERKTDEMNENSENSMPLEEHCSGYFLSLRKEHIFKSKKGEHTHFREKLKF